MLGVERQATVVADASNSCGWQAKVAVDVCRGCVCVHVTPGRGVGGGRTGGGVGEEQGLGVCVR